MSKRTWIAALLLGGLGLTAAPAPAAAQEFLGKSWEKWDKDLNSKDAKVRRGGAFALGKIGKGWKANPGDLDQVRQHLIGVLGKDDSPRVQEATAYALGEIYAGGSPPPDVLGALVEALKGNPDAAVQRSAAVALGSIGKDTKDVLAALNGQAGNQSEAVRQNVAWALGRVGEDNIATLRKLLKDKDARVRMNAANAVYAHTQLKKTPDGLKKSLEKAKAAVPELMPCCVGPDVELKKAAVLALQRLVEPEHLEIAQPLITALGDKEIEVRRNAAIALVNMGGETAKEAVPVLCEMLRKGDAAEKKTAALAIGKIGKDAGEAVEELRLALKDADLDLQIYATMALGELGPAAEKAVPELLTVLVKRVEDGKMPPKVVEKKNELRIKSAMALKNIGPNAAALEAAPTLLKVVGDDKNPVLVRDRTLWALLVHDFGALDNIKEFAPTLEKVLAEKTLKTSGQYAKLLRYNCASILGVYQRSKTSKEALEVLLDFLKDEKILLYAGTGTKVEGGGIEKKGQGPEVKEKAVGDGRVLAVRALGSVGKVRILRDQPMVVAQLEAIVANKNTFPQLREEAAKLLDELKKK